MIPSNVVHIVLFQEIHLTNLIERLLEILHALQRYSYEIHSNEKEHN